MIYYVLIMFCFRIMKSQEIRKCSNIEGALLTTFKLMSTRAAQYQYFLIDSISIILFAFLSISISLSIIFKRVYQCQYFINYSKSSLINFNINISYQYLLIILLRLPISYQLVILININIDINYQNRL